MTDFLENIIIDGRVKSGAWNNFENHKIYAEWLGKKLGYTNMDDWYKISKDILINNFGSGLLSKHYNNSPINFLKTIFTNYTWIDWKFKQTQQAFWKSKENQKKYLEWLFIQLGYTQIEDWYNISGNIIKENYGVGLLNYYNSISEILKNIYPEYNWLCWKFKITSTLFWKDKNNHKIYADWLFNKLNYKKMEDWYNISINIIKENYGGGLLNYYNRSPTQFIVKLYPEYNFLEWKFIQTKKYYWDNIENQKKYIVWLFKELKFTKMEDWYTISRCDFIKNYGDGLLQQQYNSCPIQLLINVYPEYKWEISKFKKRYSKGQIEWLNYLSVSTPDLIHILNNNNGEYKIPNSRYSADGYSNSKNTIYEYHGDYYHGNLKIYNSNDINSVCKKTFGKLYENTLKKQQFCIDNGYKYCFIWESDWNKAKFGLIKFQKIIKNKLSLV
jgi:hypothetical protein